MKKLFLAVLLVTVQAQVEAMGAFRQGFNRFVQTKRTNFFNNKAAFRKNPQSFFDDKFEIAFDNTFKGAWYGHLGFLAAGTTAIVASNISPLNTMMEADTGISTVETLGYASALARGGIPGVAGWAIMSRFLGYTWLCKVVKKDAAAHTAARHEEMLNELKWKKQQEAKAEHQRFMREYERRHA